MTKLQQPAGVALCWGKKNLKQTNKKIKQANSFAKKSLPSKPGRTSVLATLAISYHCGSGINEKVFTSGVNLAWKHVGVPVFVRIFSRENSFIQK